MPPQGMGMPPQQATANPSASQPPAEEPAKNDPFGSLLEGVGLPQIKKEKTPEPAAVMPSAGGPLGGLGGLGTMGPSTTSSAMGSSIGGPMGSSLGGPSSTMMEPRRDPSPAPPTNSNRNSNYDSFNETSKLRDKLRAAEELERRAKRQATELRTQVDDMQRNMDAMKEQMEQMNKQNQQYAMQAGQAQQQVAPLMNENAQLREGVNQWEQTCNQQKMEIERLNDEIQKLQDQVEKLSDVERSQATFQSRVADAEQRAMNAEEKMQEKDRELFQVKRERDALKADVEFYKNQKGMGGVAAPAPVMPEPVSAPKPVSMDPMGPIMTQAEIDSFKKGDQVLRKGQQCTITKIDNEINPPAVTVKVNATGQIVGTELHLLKKVNSQNLDPVQPQTTKVGEPSPMMMPSVAAPVPDTSPQTLPSSAGVAPPIVPVTSNPPAAKAAPAPSSDFLPLNEQTNKNYERFFSEADTNSDGFVDGQEAFGFFSKSSLKRSVLADIWRLVDQPQKGKLTKPQFFAMFHIVLTMKNQPSFQLPSQLPQSLRPESIDALTSGGNDDWENFDF